MWFTVQSDVLWGCISWVGALCKMICIVKVHVQQCHPPHTTHTGLDKIEHLQQHSSEQVYKIALRIIDKYFGDDQDQVDLQLAPNPAKDGEQYMFNTNTQLPEGGFQF